MQEVHRRFAAMAVLVAAGSAGCGTDEPIGGSPDANVGGTLRLTTYNAGLLDSVGYVPERLPLVTKALTDVDSDVLCVQEFWAQEHWDGLVAANQSKRPHVFRLEPRPGVTGKCSPDEFIPLRSCAEAHCASATPSNLVPCVTNECPVQVAALSGACITCLLENASSGDLAVISSQCLGTGSSPDSGAPSPDRRAYLAGGSFGIGLLSKFPFVETDDFELDSSTNRRAILYAKVNTPTLGDLSVFCTHLAPIEKGVKYEGSYGSWEGENAAHVKALIDWVAKKQGNAAQVLVLGDLNTGPSGQGIAPSVPDNYALLPPAGFDDPFLRGPNAACTFCVENPLVAATDAAANADIDHILTRGIRVNASVERLFTEPVTITSSMTAEDGGADAGEQNIEKQVRLSDHYGLRATFVK